MLAAVGQSRLMGLYEEYFGIYDIVAGQVLFAGPTWTIAAATSTPATRYRRCSPSASCR